VIDLEEKNLKNKQTKQYFELASRQHKDNKERNNLLKFAILFKTKTITKMKQKKNTKNK